MRLKRLFVLALAVLLITGTAYANWLDGHGAGDVMGQKRYIADSHRTFRLVRFVPATFEDYEASADDIVVWDVGISGDDGVTVTTTTVSGNSAIAGILANNVRRLSTDASLAASGDVGDENWVWMQTYGLATVDVDATILAITQGDALCAGVSAGNATAWIVSTATASSRAGYAGFYYNTCSANSLDVQVFIRTD